MSLISAFARKRGSFEALKFSILAGNAQNGEHWWVTSCASEWGYRENRTGQGGAGKGIDIGENMTKHRNRRKSECRAEKSR